MKTTGLVQCAGATAALAILSACASSTVAPSAAALTGAYVGRTLSIDGRLVTAARLGTLPRYAGILPDRHQRKRFEYVINNYGSFATIFDYPTSTKQFGKIKNVGGQGCTNVLYGYGKKTFWIVAADNQIEEFKVPDTPIRTLSVKYSFPSSCAMNASGDLAVGILYASSGSGGGDVVIFKNASGSGTAYPTPLDEEFFDGYDDRGNLFADGFTGNRSGFALVELPNGGSKFKTIHTSNAIQFPGSVQWDGTYLTVFDQLANRIYQYDVKGTTATLKGTVTLSGAGDCAQTWIVKGIVYCGDSGTDGGEAFSYPAGGSPIAVFTGNFDEPLGVVAAKK